MKFKKGDKVRFLNAVGEGIISKVLSDGTLYVIDETGFDVPMDPSELVLISSQTIQETVSDTAAPMEMNAPEVSFFPEGEFMPGNDETKAFFALVPQPGKDVTDADLDTYLINDSNFIAFYNIIETFKGESKSLDVGIIEPNTKIEVLTLLRQQIGNAPDYTFQLIFYKNGKYDPVAPFHKKIVLSPIKLYKEQTFKENDFFYEKCIIFELTKEDELTKTEKIDNIEATEQKKKLKELEKMLQTKKKVDLPEKKVIKKKEKVEHREIDLHINELVENTTGLDNNTIIEIQMERFESEMKKAIKDDLKKIIFIHGIGNGTLKNMVRKTLSQRYGKYSFHDASFKEYGFGATMVILRN
jgi:DNA-nicking Smr family endonuclease